MFNNILIIGCGMIGSSILRGVISQKLCKKAYVYAKNIDSTDDLIFADDGDQEFARLSPGEFFFYPTADNTKIQVKASANTPMVEFLLLEVD